MMDRVRVHRGLTASWLVGCVLLAVLIVGALSWREIQRSYSTWSLLREHFDQLPRNAQGYPEYRHKRTGIVFVLLPGGTFRMGTPEDQAGEVARGIVREFSGQTVDFSPPEVANTVQDRIASSETPCHNVVLSPFLIAKYELSQREWRDAMGENPSAFQPRAHGYGQLGANDRMDLLPPELQTDESWLKLPVEYVTWDECREFCRKTGLSLPTEAEWEYACRAGTQTIFAFGDQVTPEQMNYNTDRRYVVNTRDRAEQRTYYGGKPMPVASLAPNGFGLHHMHGNVSEWCQDDYDEGFYRTSQSTERNPECRSNAAMSNRVIRGGSGLDWPEWRGHRSAARGGISPTSRSAGIGFRPVFPLP